MSVLKSLDARFWRHSVPLAALVVALASWVFGAAPAAAQEGDSLEIALTGAAEVPGPGDPDGNGSASLTFDEGEVCYEITVSNIATPTAAHIHQGAADASGPPVVNLNVSGENLSGCVEEVDQSVIDDIRQNLANYYVNVHNAEYPAGAVRGQLDQ